MRTIRNDEQIIPRVSLELEQSIVENAEQIDKLYAQWNHYDILPDVVGKLRERSDIVASQFLIRESVGALSKAMIHDPFSGVNFSMRGRRYINLGEFDLALADFAVASRLLPENWYVWYHFGLCNLVLGDNERADQAYQPCAQIPTTPSLEVALTNWRWITFMRMSRKDDAEALLADVDAFAPMDGTESYLRLLRLYRRELTPEEAMHTPDDDENPVLSATTQSYGVANYYRVTGDMENYRKTLEKTLEIGRDEIWTCFGFAAAEYELKHLK